MVAQRRNCNKKKFSNKRRGKRLSPEQEEKKKEAERLEKLRKKNKEWN